MRLFILSVVFCSFFLSLGCEFKKSAAKVVANATAPIIATTLSCKFPEVVKADMQVKLEAWFKVNKNETEPKALAVKGVMTPICVAAVSAILPMLIDFTGKKLPEKWGCNLDLLGGSAIDLATLACGILKNEDIKEYL